MACGFPIEVGDRLRPCGKCQGCARKRRNAWTGRMLLEQSQHNESAFVTLTYADEYLPLVYHTESGEWIPTLVKSHCQSWIRSVRQKAMRFGQEIRYFAAGEYGDKGGRPHYHLIVYGTGPNWLKIYEDSWNRGFVSAYEATASGMAYVAKYCLKGGRDPELDLPTSTPHTDLTESRVTVPPFRLTSRRPAIGTRFVKNIATSLATRTHQGLLYDPSRSGPADRVRIGKMKYPLDRTMRDHLERALIDSGVQEEHVDAMVKRDYGDPTHEEISKGREAHLKALRQRSVRNKL